MDSFFSRYKNGLVLGAVLFAQVIGLAVQIRRPMANSADHQSVRLLRLWVVSVVGPPERIAHSVGLGIRGVWSNYIDLRHTRQRNRELQAEVDRLRLEQAGLAEDARQGHRLQHLLAFQEHYVYKTLPAQVIGTAGTDMSRLLLIDKGYKSGLRIDMPVITPDGIVGKIRDVFPYSAQVLEISDQSSGAGVILETTRIRGVLRGNAYGQPQIINVLPDERIQSGERVLTSGGDQVFPRGLTVGYVDKVVNDPERNPYVDIVVRPAASLFQLEEVLVITSIGDAIPQAEQADITQSEADAVRHGAAEELADKLPTIRDPNDPNAAAAAHQESEAANSDSEVARPMRPPAALHPDRFTPGASAEASALTPAASLPHPPHNPALMGPQTSPAPPQPRPAAKIPPPADANPQNGPAARATAGGTASQPGAPNVAAPSTKKLAAPPTNASNTPVGRSAPTSANRAAKPASDGAGNSTQAGATPPAKASGNGAIHSGVIQEPIPSDGVRTVGNDGPAPVRKKTPKPPANPAATSGSKPGSASPDDQPKPAPPQDAPASNPPPQGGR